MVLRAIYLKRINLRTVQATTSEKKVQLKFIHYRFRAEQVTINKRVMINQTDVVYQGSNYIKTIRYLKY